MGDPKSFEHVETRVTPVDSKGLHHLTMRYRGRNGFNAMVMGTVTASYRNDNCEVVSWAAE